MTSKTDGGLDAANLYINNQSQHSEKPFYMAFMGRANLKEYKFVDKQQTIAVENSAPQVANALRLIEKAMLNC